MSDSGFAPDFERDRTLKEVRKEIDQAKARVIGSGLRDILGGDGKVGSRQRLQSAQEFLAADAPYAFAQAAKAAERAELVAINELDQRVREGKGIYQVSPDRDLYVVNGPYLAHYRRTQPHPMGTLMQQGQRAVNAQASKRNEQLTALAQLERIELTARSGTPEGRGGAPTRPVTMPTDAAGRKRTPIASGVLDYFPDAIIAVAQVSFAGNEQHNPGQPLHWDRSKSTDEADTAMRHFMERGTRDADGSRHSAKAVWRMLAYLQKEIEEERAQEEAA